LITVIRGIIVGSIPLLMRDIKLTQTRAVAGRVVESYLA
jgi:hypothetical protein